MLRFTKTILGICALIIGFEACKINKKGSTANTGSQQLPQVTVKPAKPKPPYRPTEKRSIDIEHMKLAVSFNYDKQYVLGQAILTCKPYFYPTQSATFDAKGFDIKKVSLLIGYDTVAVKYVYDGFKLVVTLDKVYQRNQSFKIYIDYVAKPNEKNIQTGSAIKEDKGLYFINPTGTDPYKPRQIWTQGEPQSNSCWFPTVDHPNEKITQDIAITVDDKDITLSNGELMLSKMNADGKRTDYWRQTKPHAPYLVMLAVGEFAQIKDYWRDSVLVDYYVEAAYKPYAKLIFGNTPEMMEVFSKKLGVDYPWDKYSQIVVRDFVSGAMENTSAVIHYEMVQHDARAHLDNTHEDIIAHELFHHWFGDLVTCESWANLPLNESFATYGEYIWLEHKYGKEEAERDILVNKRAYLNQRGKHKTEPIRYHYHVPDEMFDVVSYQKGGVLLHQLRKIVGDEAFFESLKLYLTRNAYKTAELANLRMAFEEVTGEDLNWYFNQWFLQSGHPELSVKYKRANDNKKVTVCIEQTQDSTAPVYKLPIYIDVYTAQGAKRYDALIEHRIDTFTFETNQPILFVNTDADKRLLAKIDDSLSNEELRLMVANAPLFGDKYHAFTTLTNRWNDTLTGPDVQTLLYLLDHSFWGYRKLALDAFDDEDSVFLQPFSGKFTQLALRDKNAQVRATAANLLITLDASGNEAVFQRLINDSSYLVSATGAKGLAKANYAKNAAQIQSLKQVKNGTFQTYLAAVIAEFSTGDEVDYFEKLLAQYSFQKFSILNQYFQYLSKAKTDIKLKATNGLKQFYAKHQGTSIARFMQMQVKAIAAEYVEYKEELMAERKKVETNALQLAKIDAEINTCNLIIAAYQSILVP